MRRSSGRVRIGLILVVLAAVLSVAIALNRKNLNLGVNGSIRYDDFVFTVTSAGKAAPPGANVPLVDYEVTLVITNRARRVSFEFLDQNAVLLGPDGKEYRSAPSPPTLRPIPAGSSETRHLVYRVPASLTGPRLRIMSGGRSGDVLETVLAGRKQFVLP